ncbi:hypothetical protein GJAV_G00185320 [Gymnothorax javanicus]|nr:hypothetical protein GJAV_G00185320 [Gymnothorax javanicus]
MDRQAEVLKGFLAQLNSKEVELEEAEESFTGEFSRLKKLSTKYRTEKISTKAADKQGNVKKNRYKDIVPFDHTRVKLSLITSDSDTDYINANFIKGVQNQWAYIATQGPLPHTVRDFWRMIWEYNVEIIVMACREFEMGRKKCERYWPETKEEPFVCDPFTIHHESVENKGDYLTRILTVSYCNSSRTLWHLHYVNWPDHGIPTSIPPIIELLREMRSYQEHDDVPICIHCSAGCGRTGVLCVIDYTWKLLRNELITEDFDIFNLVQEMRKQRPSMVQTKEQYELVYRAVQLLFENYLQMMDNHSSTLEEPDSPPSPSDLTASCEVINLAQEVEVQPDPWPRQTEGEEQQEWTNQETVGVAEACPTSLTTLTQEHLSMLSPCKGDWTNPEEEEVALQQMELNPISPSYWKSSCISVEDPYFSPSSPQDALDPDDRPPFNNWTSDPCLTTPALTLNGQPLELSQVETLTTDPLASDEDTAPMVPERTPESYILDDSPGGAAPCASDDNIPPSLPARTPESFILANSTGSLDSPPSPVPPLPERTPESFILATDDDLVQGVAQHEPLRRSPRVGRSSEWCGTSEPSQLKPKKSWARSKSLKVRMSMLVSSSFLAPVPAHPVPTAPSCPAPEEESSLPPATHLADAPLLAAQEDPCIQNSDQTFLLSGETSKRVGTSSEWAGNSQPKTLLDVVMNRSKSVKTKRSKNDRLSMPCLPAQISVAAAPAGNAAAEMLVDRGASARAGVVEDTQHNSRGQTSLPCLTRTKSLRFLKNIRKPKAAVPPTVAITEPLLPCSTSSGFRFGFGNRFRKPKGPRHQPNTWV